MKESGGAPGAVLPPAGASARPYLTESVYKVVLKNLFPYKSVNLSFI